MGAPLLVGRFGPSERDPNADLGKILLGSTSMLTVAIASLQTFPNYNTLPEKHLSPTTKPPATKPEIAEKTIVLTQDKNQQTLLKKPP
ncbi:hypothetical protein [[Limnothrix rosea] IAM M-220]|uniref:hypothetical protein n=1 Tax=[Limnothrix rosea] IAM M-220 TaxID=454133 RepID=UPI00095A16B0|nr:hypothetical protein [[Limnothrix rosea] IAM M-220]OKH18181.1 hypothetical protein NIES208_06560 [[Limnothrix rosea] IAM M-220]